MRDQLPKKTRKNECCILNLDDNGKWKNGKFIDDPPGNRGTHWACWFVDNITVSHKKSKDETCYLDSFGIQPPLEIIDYLQKSKTPITYSTFQFQPSGEVFCGHLCLYILKKLQSKGRTINKQNFNEILNNLLQINTSAKN